jgi:hypothetical protein
MEWTSVDDRLPEDGREVVFAHRDYGRLVGEYAEAGFQHARFHAKMSPNYFPVSAVTHWAYPSDPPKKLTKNDVIREAIAFFDQHKIADRGLRGRLRAALEMAE